jgi:ATPase subunit of ABC transporter with duplicated ATPase domains
LDAESVSWLERFLKDFLARSWRLRMTVISWITAEWILELDRGMGIPYQGNYSSWLEQKNARLEQENKQEESFAKALKKNLNGFVQMPKVSKRKTKRVWSVLKSLTHVNSNSVTKLLKSIFHLAHASSNKVEVEGISKSFDGRVLYENLSLLYRLQRLWVSWVQTVRVKPHYSV